VGTEFGAWVSANRGGSWTKLNNNLPTVAVHEFAQHPTAGEMVAATHGRSLWVLDVTPLRQMTNDALKAKIHLYQPNTVVRWHMEQGRDGWFNESERRFAGQNPPRGAQLYYSLNQKADKVALKVLDYAGKTVAEFPGAATSQGLHRIAWNLTTGVQRTGAATGGPGGRRGAGSAAQGPPTGQRQRGAVAQRPGATAATQRPSSAEATEQEPAAEIMSFFGGAIPQISPGIYRLVLTVDGTEFSQPLHVEPDPTYSGPIVTVEEEGGDLDP